MSYNDNPYIQKYIKDYQAKQQKQTQAVQPQQDDAFARWQKQMGYAEPEQPLASTNDTVGNDDSAFSPLLYAKDAADAGLFSSLAGMARFGAEFSPFGGETLNRWADSADEVVQRNTPTHELYGLDWWGNAGGNAVGSMIPTAALTLAAGGAGSALGLGARAASVISKLPAGTRALSAAKAMWASPYGKFLATNVGSSPAEGVVEAGNLITDMRNQGYSDEDIKEAALKSAAANTAFLTVANLLEAKTLGKIADKFAKQQGKKALAQAAARGAAADAISEGFEEFGQNLIGNWAQGADPDYDEAIEAAKQGAAGGALLGGVGVGFGAYTGRKANASADAAPRDEMMETTQEEQAAAQEAQTAALGSAQEYLDNLYDTTEEPAVKQKIRDLGDEPSAEAVIQLATEFGWQAPQAAAQEAQPQAEEQPAQGQQTAQAEEQAPVAPEQQTQQAVDAANAGINAAVNGEEVPTPQQTQQQEAQSTPQVVQAEQEPTLQAQSAPQQSTPQQSADAANYRQPQRGAGNAIKADAVKQPSVRQQSYVEAELQSLPVKMAKSNKYSAYMNPDGSINYEKLRNARDVKSWMAKNEEGLNMAQRAVLTNDGEAVKGLRKYTLLQRAALLDAVMNGESLYRMNAKDKEVVRRNTESSRKGLLTKAKKAIEAKIQNDSTLSAQAIMQAREALKAGDVETAANAVGVKISEGTKAENAKILAERTQNVTLKEEKKNGKTSSKNSKQNQNSADTASGQAGEGKQAEHQGTGQNGEAEKVTLPEGYTTESGKPVAKDNEQDYILKPDGNADFGNISSEISKATNGIMQAAPIRLQVGNDGFGYIHLLKHLSQMQGKNFDNAIEYIEYIMKKFNQIYDQRDTTHPARFVLYCKGDESKGFTPLDLELNKKTDTFYTIVSAMPHNSKIKGTLIYDESATSSTATTNSQLLTGNNDNGGVAPVSAAINSVPSVTSSVAQNSENGNETVADLNSEDTSDDRLASEEEIAEILGDLPKPKKSSKKTAAKKKSKPVDYIGEKFTNPTNGHEMEITGIHDNAKGAKYYVDDLVTGKELQIAVDKVLPLVEKVEGENSLTKTGDEAYNEGVKGAGKGGNKNAKAENGKGQGNLQQADGGHRVRAGQLLENAEKHGGKLQAKYEYRKDLGVFRQGVQELGSVKGADLVNKNSRTTFKLHMLDNADAENVSAFFYSLNYARENNKDYGKAVDEQSEETLSKCKLIVVLGENGFIEGGLAIKPDGDIVAVHKNPNSKIKQLSFALGVAARENGGVKLDCYGETLVNMYRAVGFEPVARIDHNSKYAKGKGEVANQKMDVYTMMRTTEDSQAVVKRHTENPLPTISKRELSFLEHYDKNSYDKGIAHRDDPLKRQGAGEDVLTAITQALEDGAGFARNKDGYITKLTTFSDTELEKARELNDGKMYDDIDAIVSDFKDSGESEADGKKAIAALQKLAAFYYEKSSVERTKTSAFSEDFKSVIEEEIDKIKDAVSAITEEEVQAAEKAKAEQAKAAQLAKEQKAEARQNILDGISDEVDDVMEAFGKKDLTAEEATAKAKELDTKLRDKLQEGKQAKLAKKERDEVIGAALNEIKDVQKQREEVTRIAEANAQASAQGNKQDSAKKVTLADEQQNNTKDEEDLQEKRDEEEADKAARGVMSKESFIAKIMAAKAKSKGNTNAKYSAAVTSEIKRSFDEIEAEIKAAIPNASFSYLGNGLIVAHLPNGKNIGVQISDQIILGEKETQKAAQEHGLSGDIIIEGSWQKVSAKDIDGVIRLSRESLKGTGIHEVLHMAMDLGLTERERAALLKSAEARAKEQGVDTEEALADMYKEWWQYREGKRKAYHGLGKIWQKISDFVKRMRAALTGAETVDDIFRKIESGEVFERADAEIAAGLDGDAKYAINKGVDLDKQVNVVDLTGKIPKGRTTTQDVLAYIRKLAASDKNYFDTKDGEYTLTMLPKHVNHVTYSSDWTRKTRQEIKARNTATLSIGNLVKEAVLVESIPNEKSDDKANVEAYHRFYVPIKIGNNIYTIRIVAEQTIGGATIGPTNIDLYDVIIEKNRSALKSKTLFSTAGNGSTISIREMLKNVKGYDKKKYINSDGSGNFKASARPRRSADAKIDDINQEYKHELEKAYARNADIYDLVDIMNKHLDKLGEHLGKKAAAAKVRAKELRELREKFRKGTIDQYQIGGAIFKRDNKGQIVVEKIISDLAKRTYVNRRREGKTFDTPTQKMADVVHQQERKGFLQKGKDFVKDQREHFYRNWIDKYDDLEKFDKAVKEKGIEVKSFDSIKNATQRIQNSSNGKAQAMIEGNAENLKVLSQQYGFKINKSFKMIMDELHKRAPAMDTYLKKNFGEEYTNDPEAAANHALASYLAAEQLLEGERVHMADYNEEVARWEQNGSKGKPPRYEGYRYAGGLTKAECEAVVKATPAGLKKLAQDYYQLNKDLLHIMVKTNLISAETEAHLNKRYEHYCPLMRDFSDTEAVDAFIGQINAGGKGIANVSDPLRGRRSEGSSRDLVSPLEMTVKSVANVIARGERNKVGLMLVDRAKQAGLDNLVRRMEGTSGDAKNCIYTVMRGGKKEAYQTTPELYPAVTMGFEPAIKVQWALLTTPAKMLRLGSTSSPQFIVSNLLRDTIFAGISSKNGFIPIVDSIRGAMELLNNPQLRAEFENSGISSSATYGSLESIAERIDEMTGGKKLSSTGDILKAAVKMFENGSDFVEAMTRMGEFAKARKNNKSIEEAAQDAVEITLNFGRSGVEGQQANKVIPFFNACIQGADKVYRLFRDDFVGTSMKIGQYIILPSLLLWAANHDEDWYKELDPNVKATNWVLPGGVKIPKPQEVGYLFGTGTEAILTAAYDNDPKAMKAWAEAVKEALMPGILPTAILPIIEWQANYSMFRGKPVENQQMQRLPEKFRFGDYTSETSKFIGDKTNLSPAKIDNLVRSVTGTMGMALWQVPDLWMPDKLNLPEKKWNEQALTRRFFVNDMEMRRTMSDFYELHTAVQQQRAAYGKKGAPAKDASAINTAYASVSKISKKIREVTADARLNSEQKRMRIDKLKAEQLRIGALAVKHYGSKYGI